MTAVRCLPVADVAERLGVSRDAVYDLVSTGALKPVRVGRRISIPEAELERFVAAGGTTSP